jgi:1,4-alpha-glucan branching enzyme
MKHLSLILLAALTFEATAQTTFNVDMTCAPESDNVFVTGPFCGWCSNEDFNTMTDDDGDGVHTVVLEDLTGTVEYKYAINGFAFALEHVWFRMQLI